MYVRTKQTEINVNTKQDKVEWYYTRDQFCLKDRGEEVTEDRSQENLEVRNTTVSTADSKSSVHLNSVQIKVYSRE